MDFEILTLCPIDLRLIEPSLLDAAETAWLDAYHRRVLASLRDAVEEADREWLEQATRPLGN
jgi:Xaa-Pro aminopeptidase